MACQTEEEISEILDTPRTTIQTVLTNLASLPDSSKPDANHLTDFDPPLYNIWKQQEKSAGLGKLEAE